jgi:hypothetical protein
MLQPNTDLIRQASNCGGGLIHVAVQYTTAYEFAVVRFNHRNTKPESKPEISREIEQLEIALYGIVAGNRPL